MATPRQVAANRDWQKSTGPTAPEGKTISSRNRVSSGFNSTTTYFLDHENAEEFWQSLEDFTNQYQPANPTEQVLVEKMVHNQWLSLRAIRLQRDRLFHREFSDPIPQDLGLLIRYQTAADRAFHKAHTELVKAQKERDKSTIGFESKNADPAPQPAPESPAPEFPVESPQKPPAARPTTPQIATQPGITPAEKELATELAPELAADSEYLSQAA